MAPKTNNVAKNQRFIDITVLILLPVIATVATLSLPLNLFWATIILFGPPALYLSWRNQRVVAHNLLYSCAVSFISILSDYLAERDSSWVSTTMFSFKIISVVPIEAILWVFLLTYLIIAWYHYFYQLPTPRLMGYRMKYVLIAAASVTLWAFCVSILHIGAFSSEYFYLKSGTMFILLPLIAFVCFYPRILSRTLQILPYFFSIGLTNLLVSLQKNHWSYPGTHFIGFMQLGSYRFPIEEFVFWIVLYAPFLITQYELFNSTPQRLASLRKS